MALTSISIGLFRARKVSGRLALLALLSFLAVVLQPCAMAMDHQADPEPDCHEMAPEPAILSCLSQPLSQCASDQWLPDARDAWQPDFNALWVTDLAEDNLAWTQLQVAAAGQHRWPPPADKRAPNIRFCVFLK